MKTINKIRDCVCGRGMAYSLARKDAIKFEHAELASSLLELATECSSIVEEIDKIVAEAAKRRREIRDAVIMAVLGAGVAVLALYLMFYV